MPECQRCKSSRVLQVSGKVSDMFSATTTDWSDVEPGYVPDDIGLGEGDYMELDYCLNCGQIQGKFPLLIAEIERGK
jgi:hypothetical protein